MIYVKVNQNETHIFDANLMVISEDRDLLLYKDGHLVGVFLFGKYESASKINTKKGMFFDAKI